MDDSEIADRVFAAASGGPALPPITDSEPGFDVARAYRVLALLHDRRRAQGWRSLGRKIGFTNWTIWERYGVDRPMWSHVWDRTVQHAVAGRAGLALAGFHEPRIEPELVFKLAGPLPAGDDPLELLAQVEWIAAGFEIVHSMFPGWRFRAPDCTVAFGLHGALVVGEPLAVTAANRSQLAAALPTFPVQLFRAGELIEQGSGANVLGSPLNALAHLRDTLAAQPDSPPLAAGEIVTTGTLTDAQPVAPGETWTSRYDGLGIAGLAFTFR